VEGEELVRGDEHVHEVLARVRESVLAYARADPHPVELVPDRVDDLDEEEVLLGGHHKRELQHSGDPRACPRDRLRYGVSAPSMS
jgi:hypothetical protein